MNKKIIFILGIIISLSFIYGCDDSFNTSIRQAINNYIIPLLVSAVGVLVSYGLVQLQTWLGIKISTDKEKQFQLAAEQIVQEIAEKTAAQIKFDKIVPDSNTKLKWAIELMLKKVPKLTPEQADAQIHAALARLKGVGATDNISVTKE